jgi:hypothetical protein
VSVTLIPMNKFKFSLMCMYPVYYKFEDILIGFVYRDIYRCSSGMLTYTTKNKGALWINRKHFLSCLSWCRFGMHHFCVSCLLANCLQLLSSGQASQHQKWWHHRRESQIDAGIDLDHNSALSGKSSSQITHFVHTVFVIFRLCESVCFLHCCIFFLAKDNQCAYASVIHVNLVED